MNIATITSAPLPKFSGPTSQVYFIQDEKGRVKIGWSADVASRISGLQVASACCLFLIRVIEGGPATEAWLHRKFKAFRIRGEWFRFDEAMMTIVPPDEIPVRQRVVSRRDVGLTIKEHVASVDAAFAELSSKEKLFLLMGRLTEAQSFEVLGIIRGQMGLSSCEAA